VASDTRCRPAHHVFALSSLTPIYNRRTPLDTAPSDNGFANWRGKGRLLRSGVIVVMPRRPTAGICAMKKCFEVLLVLCNWLVVDVWMRDRHGQATPPASSRC